MFGSPAITQASDVPAHQLTASPPQFVIGVGGSEARYTAPRLGEPPGGNINQRVAFIPIVLAGGEMPRDSARALYERMLVPGAIERAWKRRVAHADSIRLTTLRITTPDTLLNRAVEWAKVNLDEAMVCNPDLGCGLVAGYGLSGGASDRPGFGWFFGGDAAINSFAMSAIGQYALVRDGVFRFFAKYQRADGKITHEISQGAGKVDWFGAYPYAFYHGDTTPFWILAFGEYWKQSADTALVRELWPNVRKAYEWSRSADSDGDGLMENTIAGAGALEVGDLQIGIVSDVYLSGVWIAALERFARMAEAMLEPRLAAESRALRSRAVRTLEQKLWMPEIGQYAFAILEGGAVSQNLTAWPATAMSFDVFDARNGAAMASRLASASIMTDWGARPLAATSALFDPLHYNNGAVWPFVTGWVALAQYRYRNPHAGYFALRAIARTGFDESLGRNPEVISGRLYKPLDTAVPHQFFATSMVLTPLVRGLLGVEVDAPARRLTIAPQLPADWPRVTIEHLAVGSDRLTIEVTQRADSGISARIERERDGPPIEIVFAPSLSLGSREIGGSALVDGVPTHVAVQAEPTAGNVRATLRASMRRTAELRIDAKRGWSIEVPQHVPAIGDRSSALRVISERLEMGQYLVQLQGRAGSSHGIRVTSPSGSGEIAVSAGGGKVHAMSPESPRRLAHRYRLVVGSEDADADGFVTVMLTITNGR